VKWQVVIIISIWVPLGRYLGRYLINRLEITYGVIARARYIYTVGTLLSTYIQAYPTIDSLLSSISRRKINMRLCCGVRKSLKSRISTTQWLIRPTPKGRGFGNLYYLHGLHGLHVFHVFPSTVHDKTGGEREWAAIDNPTLIVLCAAGRGEGGSCVSHRRWA
jgi:hypothetical protein